MSNNKFKINSTQYKDFETMSDLKWHCTKCELLSGQAKTWQVWRQEKGIKIKMDGDKYYKKIYCNTCGKNTVQRALESLEIGEIHKARTGIPSNLAKKVKAYYGNIDAFTLRKESPAQLEIDHRIPQIRWTSSEEDNSVGMSEDEILKKFMLLTRSNNLLKSRYCEKCVKTGERAAGYDINFWYKGDIKFEQSIGCDGCFWFNPHEWRLAIKKIVE